MIDSVVKERQLARAMFLVVSGEQNVGRNRAGRLRLLHLGKIGLAGIVACPCARRYHHSPRFHPSPTSPLRGLPCASPTATTLEIEDADKGRDDGGGGDAEAV